MYSLSLLLCMQFLGVNFGKGEEESFFFAIILFLVYINDYQIDEHLATYLISKCKRNPSK